jgi:hypothetical protein
MIKELTDLLIAFSSIQINNKTVMLASIIAIGVFIRKFFSDRKFDKYYNDMKQEKNKEIERLADDNRRYRDIYLSSLGIKQAEINQISAANVKGE